MALVTESKFVVASGVNMEFKVFLRERRKQLDISQEDLAARLSRLGHETGHARISHWETGRNKPPIDQAEFRTALAIALEMDVNDMMSVLGYVITDPQRSEQARLAADIIDQLPPDRKDLALTLLRALAEK